MKDITNDIKSIVLKNSLIFDSLSYYKKDGTNYLEILVDKDGGVDIADLDPVTEDINAYLDETDPIDEEYTLLIQSVGVEREVAYDDLCKYVGEYFIIKTPSTTIVGTLKSVDGSTITINNKQNKNIKIDANDCVSCTRTIKF